MNKEQKAFIRAQYQKVWGNDGKMVDYCTGRTSDYIDIDGVIITFDKPYIETQFCFGEHGYDFDEVQKTCDRASRSESYFVNENMRGTAAAAIIERLEGNDWRCLKPYLKPRKYYKSDDQDGCRLGCIVWARSDDEYDVEGLRMLTDEEQRRLLETAKAEQGKFEKRLRTYLKRYGMSKCRFWTYWADR